MKTYDVIIIGAGAAGLSAASAALSNKKSVAVIDMGNVPARKIAVSGGGHCNFTNAAVAANKYFGHNPDFTRSAISKISPNDILNWVKQHKINWIEKTSGQYFCKETAKDFVDALISDAKKADFFMNNKVEDLDKNELFRIKTNKNFYTAKSVIIATGGISYPVLNVSDVGYKIAKKFGHKIIPVRPALCAISTKIFSSELSGISLDVEINIGKEIIYDSMLITHFGLGGPAIYRATVRNIDADIHINLLPNTNVFEWLKIQKQQNGKKSLANILSSKLPLRLARWLTQKSNKNIADYKDTELKLFSHNVSDIIVKKDDFKLYNLQSAEVVRGGVSTEQISSKTMESKLCPGMFFAGEVLDVTGDLGGFNLHWALSSGRIAGENA